MRNSFLVLTIMLGALIVLPGCGQPTPTAAPPTVTPTVRPPKPTAKITIETVPTPPNHGEVEILLTVTDSNGLPINNADVFVYADHVTMTGMGTTGTAIEKGDGKYTFKGNFGMTGDWKLTIQVQKPPLDDFKEFRLLFR